MSNIVKFPVQEKTAAQVVQENRARRISREEEFKKEIEELKRKISAFKKSDVIFSE